MAFYEYDAAHEAVQTIGRNDPIRSDGVGAYYAYDASHEAVQPVNGTAFGASAELADEQMRGIFRNRRPLFVGQQWAARVSDAVWGPPPNQNELTLVPVTDAEISETRRRAFGHEIPMVAVLSGRPPSATLAAGAFVGTPYEFSAEIALYAPGDRNGMPRPVFLTTATLRDADDEDGGSGSLAQTAATLGGKLVYVIALPAKMRPRQLPPIQQALQAYSVPVQSSAALQTAGAPPPPATPARVSLNGPVRSAFHKRGMLGTVSTPTLLLGGALALVAGVAVAAAAMGGGR